MIYPILRGWVNYFRIGHSSRCFSKIQDWVEKKIRRHRASIQVAAPTIHSDSNSARFLVAEAERKTVNRLETHRLRCKTPHLAALASVLRYVSVSRKANEAFAKRVSGADRLTNS